MTGKLIIRLAELDQVEQIHDLTLRAYAKWVPITLRRPLPMTVDYSLAVQEHRFDCLYEDANLVGLIETVQQGDELLIVNVAVDPSHQRRGFGTHLMKHAEKVAKDIALSAIRLYTNKRMSENIAFYERLGYQFEKETHHDPGTVAIHMVLPLS